MMGKRMHKQRRKKYLKCIEHIFLGCMLLLFIEMFPLSIKNSYAAQRHGYVNYAYLNLRAKPEVEADLVIKLSQNDRVEILTDLNGWYEVYAFHGGETYYGYVSAQYVVFSEQTTPDSEASEYEGYVNNSWMNLRSGPSTATSVVVILSFGDKLTIKNYADDWYQVVAYHNGKAYEGYAYGDYVTIGEYSSGNSESSGESHVGHVADGKVSLRAEPSTGSSVVVVLDQFEELEILSEQNGWYKVNAYHENVVYNGYIPEKNAAKGYPEVGIAAVGYVNSAGLKLQVQPGSSAGVVVKLTKYDPVTLCDYNEGWYQVIAEHNAKKYEGYVAENYISFDLESIVGKNTLGYVDYSWLNLREEPNTASAVVKKLSRNDRLEIEAHSKGWYKVTAHHDGSAYRGYVADQYVAIGFK